MDFAATLGSKRKRPLEEADEDRSNEKCSRRTLTDSFNGALEGICRSKRENCMSLSQVRAPTAALKPLISPGWWGDSYLLDWVDWNCLDLELAPPDLLMAQRHLVKSHCRTIQRQDCSRVVCMPMWLTETSSTGY
eukprot:TRINITY_DN2972_c0_g2_i1.p1 TRINITY_DN2972_c0_g2~~TRINITY_DN2972_c0_g2_i1.p1  ORF type:complete len:135 (+),score=4.88 TRINITY_DN2972_c0_g2_i1:72-476(+)